MVGPSRSLVIISWGILWSVNFEVIDPVSPHHTAVDINVMAVASLSSGRDKSTTESR